MEISTGKRVNQAADDPSAIGRIQRMKSLINETKIAKNALEHASLRNKTMENTLTQMGEISTELYSLSIEYNGVTSDKETLEKQASSLLDEMVDMQASTRYNGSNPFTKYDELKSRINVHGIWPNAKSRRIAILYLLTIFISSIIFIHL